MGLDRIPPEVLEHIAFFVATESILGPPVGLLSLLLANRSIYNTLSTTANPHLYSLVFRAKFDSGLIQKRYGDRALAPDVLTKELKRRIVLLKRIRASSDAVDATCSWDGEDTDNPADQLLLEAYLIMLENQGKNERQLRHYAKLPQWLKAFWFHERGASTVVHGLKHRNWPHDAPRTAFAMWLFWFFLNTVSDEYPRDYDAITTPRHLLQIIAMGAHHYELSEVNWRDYHGTDAPSFTKHVTWFSQKYSMVPPVLAIPAILSFFAFISGRSKPPLTPSDPTIPTIPLRDEWGAEWGRTFSLGNLNGRNSMQDCVQPGSFEGVWEGLFTYMEFSTYGSIIRGAPPEILQKSIINRHQQTWKLREHHLIAPDSSHVNDAENLSSSSSEVDNFGSKILPLSAGDPLRSYIPADTVIVESREGLIIEEPGRDAPMHYTRAGQNHTAGEEAKGSVIDIIITGEGHSAWGQFNLVGRVRPCDGFISLSKEYADGERGKWLYRGYLVGNAYGNIAGRWRDTFTSSLHAGYEGCFTMSRRR
ncbi:hypothetical protein FA15DRAFT_582977 [Coprinopsis marcescibilis]|uniref:F-box domain-containing protein n=1 Tax=Coprinopsis marcescibilis TaxID=230819 RepID=A0A5C3L903_COPMA|nr:hypothetical protein FA15DRAFT_582977 [Coprinopsis marcescibilis]